MGLDIKEFKTQDMVKGENAYVGNPDIIRESEQKRFRDPKLVDLVIEWEKKRLETENKASLKRKDINDIKKAIGAKKKVDKKDPCEEEMKQKAKFEQEIKDFEAEEQEALKQRDILLGKIANIVHESVPVHKDEEHNKIERTWNDEKVDKNWKVTEEPGFCHHHQILRMIDGYDPIKGQQVAGHRGYFLKGFGFILNQALVQFGTKFLIERGYIPMQPPYFMTADKMAQTCQLSDFDEQLYKISAKHGGGQKEESKLTEEQSTTDYYMIATSEQPISAYHSGDWLDIKEGEPIKYAGFSTNFRKEAGSAGRETWGIYRVHQFEKIEQFIICRPEESWQHHENMVKVAEEFLQALELPYQVVNIVSGALNDAAAKKYDIEAWFPGYGEYKELMSVSNCTDFQARALEVRCGQKKKDDKIKKYVHMLNGTLCATERTLTCILENYQEKDGLRVPKALVPYVGTDFIKYTQPVPKMKDLQKQK
ncbi:tRNA-binding arm [Pseudocohnilembus persalinus]|uniref:serine--tRNA ligase n=1 Tax=Pseudocohnilembus persalinus TaxID=266149 RepID=A0A0V0Q9J8_PSEPJ|nr:tRNA-binding arm [Pseudocohnilembus persalinus]|eukprot:KRW98826.1 tRNA-binding arm [Pseudocohnilembus persalinus]